MNKAAIQRFAIQARTDLIDQVSQRAYQYGITKDGYGEANAVTVGGRALNTDEQRQRKELVEQIRQKGYTQVMEEVAYTWFNRFIALRFMEVNNYLPSHIRIFSDSTGAFKPEILNDALHLDMPGLNMDKVAEYIEKNQTEDLYRYLLLTQCNALNDALPRMFEKLGGFSELLLPNNILKQDSVLGRMVTDIPEEDWTDQVQIIGWLYQYYNSELKDDTFALLKKNVKITKERIPSATQLFTPDWIVRYMVENSLGRLWLEGHPDDELKAEWKYYLDEAQQEADVQAQLEEIRAEYRTIKPQDIKVIDPCMGSGHILVYAFDVLVQIYKKYGISERDAAQSILENNLYGLDIDDRAAQLAYFAVMMKARQYDRRIFSRGIQPHVYSIMETNALGGSYKLAMGDFLLPKEHQETLNYLLDAFIDAKEYGSILQLEDRDYNGLMEAWRYSASQTVENMNISLWFSAVEYEIPKIIEQAILLTQKYDAVFTNPPYMGSSGMNAKLSDFTKAKYSESKNDLFSCCIAKSIQMIKPNRFIGMITMESWMYLSSFESFRISIVQPQIIQSLVHMPYLGKGGTSLGINFGTSAFVLSNARVTNFLGEYTYIRYFETDEEGVPLEFPTKNFRYSFVAKEIYSRIPGNPIIYSAKDKLQEILTTDNRFGDKIDLTGGQHKTADNERFVRLQWEIDARKYGAGWINYSKGGSFRKWWGNIELVVNWQPEAIAFYKSNKTSNMIKEEYWMRDGITWTATTNYKFSARILPPIGVFDVKGPALFPYEQSLKSFYLGWLNSNTVYYLLKLFKEGSDFQNIEIKRLPLVDIDDSVIKRVTGIVDQNLSFSKQDWDAFETSWEFKRHPLAQYETVSKSYTVWEDECDDRFATLKSNEEELNRIFIDIYGLQDELTPEVEDKNVTVRKADLGRDIRSLISYAVGCMFGRYSLDVDGLAYAGGEWDTSKFSTYIPDKDNIIPICDDDYFDDDITGRFVKWVETVYGSETLEENLKFIADALGGKGTPREVIRSYFINDFYADHLKIYQKRPIYWLFDSGKKNGFKALIYMHRYQSDLLARMRTDYVHEQQERYRTQLMHIADAIDHASASERVKLTKQQKKLQEQSLEIQKYEEKIHHIADQNIQIDLDDGVNHNYELFAEVLAKRK